MLYLVATPIGNLEDMCPRGVQALRDADILACEDTRRTRVLLTHFDVPRPERIVSYREQTEARLSPWLVAMLREGRTVVLCTDGGYPGISDPGYRLISLAADEGLESTVIPGASAVAVALLASALPSSSYLFKGYPPRKGGPLRRFFADEVDRPPTLIFFESPFRVAASLEAALGVLGDRRAAVCVELTKKFERVSRGYLSDLVSEFQGRKVKGEVTIVVAGNHPKFLRAGVGEGDPGPPEKVV